jgi:hypothetical protein
MPLRDSTFADFDPDRPDRATSPFEWSAGQVDGVQILPAGASTAPGLRFRIAPDGFGTVVRQGLILEPGRYALSAETDSHAAFAAGVASWSIGCAGGPARLPMRPLPPIGSQAHALTWVFEIPQDCRRQQLSLRARGDSFGAADSEILVNRIGIAPERLPADMVS